MEKNPEIADSYQKVIKEYLEKNYIRRVPADERTPLEEWLLPHFPVVRADRSTTKTKIVFYASAKFQGKGLNSEELPGPKLQGDMFSILVRFRKELVALVGDVGQMYHQLNKVLMEKYGSEQGARSFRILEIRIWRVLLSFLRTVCVAEACG